MNRNEFHRIDFSEFLQPAKTVSTGLPVGLGSRLTRDTVSTGAAHPESSTRNSSNSVFVPEHYEPNYAYPLIVWIHGAHAQERDLQTIMPLISSRNYFGISLPHANPAADLHTGVDWTKCPKPVPAADAALHAAVCDFRRNYHIHSERIFLAGFDAGATLALELTLLHPEWFGGAIAFGSRRPKLSNPLRCYRQLQGKRILLGTDRHASQRVVADTASIGQLLHVAGMDVTTRAYDADDEITSEMFMDVDRWIMNAIYHPEPA